jgi:hypothetical protein
LTITRRAGDPPAEQRASADARGVDDGEEAATGAVADAGPGDGQMGLGGAGAADEHHVALVGEELAAGEIVHQGGVDRGAVEGEVAEVLGQRQPGDGHLMPDRARLLLGDRRGQQVADDPLRLVPALHRGGDDLVVGGLHAEQLQPAPCRLRRHPSGGSLRDGLQDLRALHRTALLRRSYRAQSAAGAWRSLRACGVTMVIEAAGSRRRARMLKITSAEWTPWPSASWQAASTAGRPSLRTAVRMSTNRRSPSAAPTSLRRTRSSPAGSTQFLNGAPLRSAPGLRASTGT